MNENENEFKRVVESNLTNRELAFSLKTNLEKQSNKIEPKSKKIKKEIKEYENEEEYDYSRMIS